MSRRAKIVLAVVAGGLVLLLVLPFLIPVGPAPGTVPAAELVGEGGLFIELDGISVHVKDVGEGGPALLLLHGFGASVFSWREVVEPLSREGRVAAFDRPGFGLTERPLRGQWLGESPYGAEAQVELTVSLMDALGLEEAVLVGHSAGATVAVLVALEYPERVTALVLVAPSILTSGGGPGWLRPLLAIPQVDHLGPLVVRRLVGRLENVLDQSWYDPSLLTEDVREGYKQALRVEGWDRGLWEILRAPQPRGLAGRLGEIQVPTLVISGDNDGIVPVADSMAAAEAIPGARFALIPRAGHLPHEERPDDFLEVVKGFLSELFGGS